MPKLKSDSMQNDSALNLLEPLDFKPVPDVQPLDESIDGTDATVKSPKKPRAKAKTATGEPRKPRAKRATKASKAAANFEATNVPWSVERSQLGDVDRSEQIEPELNIELETDSTVDSSVQDEAAAIVQKRRGHTHENGILCEFCKLDDADFEAAYKLMKSSDRRSRQTAELNSIQAPVFIAPPEEETARPRLSRKMVTGLGILAVIAVIAAIWNEESSYTRALSLSDFGNKTFVTPDRDATLKFLHNAVSLSNDVGTTVVKAHRWQDNWRDQMALVFGQPEQTLWLKQVPQGFQAQDGTIFYGKDSADMKVIDAMNAVRDSAEKMYQSQGHYPVSREEVATNTYPGAVAVSQVNVNEEIGSNLITAQGATGFENALKTGSKFSREQEVPNSVSCLEVKSEPSIASDFNSYGWKTHAFFVHGFDSKGKLIRGSNGNPALLLSLKNGKQGVRALPDKAIARPAKPTSVWIYSDEMPNEGSIKFGYIAAIMMIILTIAGAVVKKVHDNCMH